MRNLSLALLMSTLVISLCTVRSSSAGTEEKLLELLVRKGILTQAEVDTLKEAVEKEESTSPTPVPATPAGISQVAQASTTSESSTQTEGKVKVSGKKAPDAGIPKGSGVVLADGKVKFSGDLRLRYDIQARDEGPPIDTFSRNRGRYRLRFGIKANPSETTELGFRLVSGTGFQNTSNQSFDAHFRGKQVFIDRVYAGWKPTKWFAITGGKQKNPFVTTDLVWDSDVSPEGLAEVLKYSGERTEVSLNLTQFFIEELSLKETNRDPMLFGYQVGTKVDMGKGTDLQLAVTYNDFKHLYLFTPRGLGDPQTFPGYNHGHSQQMVFDQNGNLLNEFRTVDFVARLNVKDLLPLPLQIFGQYIRNPASDLRRLVKEGAQIPFSNPNDLLAYGDDNRDMGYQFGISFGSQGRKKDLYLRWFYQVLEDYAFPAVFVDSDFHGGGTNNQGHRATIKYFLLDNIYLQGNFFFTKRNNEAKDGKRDENRIQLDAVFSF